MDEKSRENGVRDRRRAPRRQPAVLSEALAALGKDLAHLGASAASQAPVWDAISTGVLSLDMAIGIGGLPRGQMVEISGPPGLGKTTLALTAIAAAQAEGLEAALIDAEHRFNAARAAALGVDLDRLILVPGGKEVSAADKELPPMTAEDALSATEALIDIGIPIIAIDSLAVLTPRAEMDGDIGDNHMGLQQRLIAQFCRRAPGKLARSGSVLLLLNQITANIGGAAWGPTTKAKGGYSVQFQVSLHIEVKKAQGSVIKEGDRNVGIRSVAKIVKNSVGAPFGEAEFDIYSGACQCHAPGIDRYGELFDLAVSRGVIVKDKNTYSFGEEKLGVGRTGSTASLQNPELFAAIRKAVTGR